MLYGGCVLPYYKHLYVIGTQQVRYGIGPLLTPGSRLVAKIVKIFGDRCGKAETLDEFRYSKMLSGQRLFRLVGISQHLQCMANLN